MPNCEVCQREIIDWDDWWNNDCPKGQLQFQSCKLPAKEFVKLRIVDSKEAINPPGFNAECLS